MGPLLRIPIEMAAALERGALVLTASARAARALHRSYAEDARAVGRVSWQAPAIEDWATWLDGLYRRLALSHPTPMPLLLSTLQEELLWSRVQEAEAAQVVSPRRLARLAQSGYALLSAYEGHPGRRAPWAAAHEDAEQFLRWAAAFDEQCAALQVLPRAELEGVLRQHVAVLGPVPELWLVGFDRLTPAQNGLLAALERTGLHWQHAPANAPAATQTLTVAADEQQELQACAAWVRAQLEEDPRRRLAVLVPELGTRQAEMDRVFRRTLLPQGARSAARAAGSAPYEFSLGAPLGSVPVVHAALLLLRWLAGPLPAAELSSLLLGGFVAGGAADARQLAQADVLLRKRALLTTEITMGALLRHAQRMPGLLPALFEERLRAAYAWAQAAARPQAYTAWAEQAAEQIEALGWPGASELSSVAYQARTRWESLLGQAAALSFAGDRVSLPTFAQKLQGFALDTLFAAESRGAPVQILGAAEASGQSFDAVWFLHVTEGRWPAGGRMHPLLAPSLQRDTGMPHASTAADCALAEEQLRRVVASAPLVVCSSVLQLDGADARPSPLLRGFAGGVAAPAEAAAPRAAQCEALRVLEPTAVAPWPPQRGAGGSEVLKRQAACGFQSFAGRLGASPLGNEAWGLDAGRRALLLHRALEQLWSTEAVEPGSDRLHTRDDLRQAIGDGSLDTLLPAAVARSFAGLEREAEDDPWRMRYLKLEQQRLCTRLHAWLAIEQERADFKVIGLEESLRAVEVGALRLSLRADRVDEVAEGKRLILDYKTADRVLTGLWMGERPEEPQLPIYALFGGIEDVEGIVFAQLRAAKTRLVGLSVHPATQIGAMVKPDRSELTGDIWQGWDTTLRALADQYLRGEAPVNPRDGAKTCALCGLEGVCRVREQPGAMPAGDPED